MMMRPRIKRPRSSPSRPCTHNPVTRRKVPVLFSEYRVGTCTMVNSAFDLFTRPGDLAFQRGHPRLELHDGQPVEVLAQQRGHRVVGARAQDVVQVHRQHR
ncbi:conserved hypothetical protein [Sphingomonas sp. 8AM]|nr:conserved hypothetical protein [Sphingomonas sp. 8AM]